MLNFENISNKILEFILTDCLFRIEGSKNESYIENQIQIFKRVETELLKRNKVTV